MPWRFCDLSLSVFACILMVNRLKLSVQGAPVNYIRNRPNQLYLTSSNYDPLAPVRDKLLISPSAQLIEGDLMRDLMQFNSFRQQASMLNSVMQPAQSRMQQAFMGGQPQSMMMNPFAMQAAQSPWSYGGMGGGGMGGMGGLGLAAAMPFFGKLFE